MWWFLKAVWCLLSSNCYMSELFLSLSNIKFLDRTNKWVKLWGLDRMIETVSMTVMHFNNWVVCIFFLSLCSQAHSKLATCQTCKTLIKTGEVLHGLGIGGVMGSYCSVNCLNKGKLTTASFVGKQADYTSVPAMCCCCSFYLFCVVLNLI